jgi:hypothetical protein
MRSTAIRIWELHSTLCFDREETLCLMHGIVISLPHLYIMAMPVHSSMSDQQIYDNAHTRHPRQLSKPDMLHIVHAVGRLSDFRALYHSSPALQFPLICYHKRGRRYFRRISIQKFFP